MAKMELSKIKVVNVGTGNALEYLANKTPFKTSAGHTAFGEINGIGFAELQAQGFPVYNDKDWKNLLQTTFKLSDNAMGRGPAWNSPEDRTKFKVYINDIEFAPALKGQTEDNGVTPALAVAQPQMVPTPMAAPQPMATAKADTAISRQDEYVKLIRQYKALGKTDDQIVGGLANKIGMKNAQNLFELAMVPIDTSKAPTPVPQVVAPIVPQPQVAVAVPPAMTSAPAPVAAPQPVAVPTPVPVAAPVVPTPAPAPVAPMAVSNPAEIIEKIMAEDTPAVAQKQELDFSF